MFKGFIIGLRDYISPNLKISEGQYFIGQYFLIIHIFWCTGKALSLALAKKGIFVTIMDSSEVKGKETVMLIEGENKKFHQGLKFPSAMFIRCDVSNHGKSLSLSLSLYHVNGKAIWGLTLYNAFAILDELETNVFCIVVKAI